MHDRVRWGVEVEVSVVLGSGIEWMVERTVIGIDIGTQGTKAVLFGESGECLAVATRKSRLYRPGGGIVEEDPEYQVRTVCQTIKACVKEARIARESVVAVGIDGQMAGVIGIGKDGRNVTPYDSWLDSRCAPYIARMRRQAGKRVLRQTGCAPSFNHGPKVLWWKHEHPKVYRSTASFVQPGGYAAMRLCGLDGRAAFIDSTYLHFSGFADNRKGEWDDGLCRVFEVDRRKLPQIVPPAAIIGEVTPQMARRCGLRSGTPVVAGCGDTAASFLACGATREGICVDVAGTASVFAGTTRQFRADNHHLTLGCGRAATDGLWHPYAYVNGGGMNLEWFRREMVNHGHTAGEVTFEQLNQLAEQVSSPETAPLFIPHLGGCVCPSAAHLRGAWVGLDWSHGLGHLYRAVLEGVALEYGIYRNILVKLYPDLKLREIRVTGGGQESVLWNRIKSAVLEMPVVQTARTEGAPMGTAMLAGFGAGLFKSLPGVASRWVQKGTRCKVPRKMAQIYRARLGRYKQLLELLNGYFDQRQD